MAEVKYFQFAVFGVRGVERIEVIAETIPEAVKIAEEWELDGQRPIKVELMNTHKSKYQFVGKE